MASDFGYAILVVILRRFFHYMDGDFGALHWLLLLLLLLLQHLVLLADPLADPSTDPLSLSLLVCSCVGVFGFVVSVVDFWFLWLIFDFVSVGVCVSEEEEDDEGVSFVDGEEREKKGAKLEIIKIMYRRATVTVHNARLL